MLTFEVAILKVKLRKYLENVKRGKDILVMEHGRPIARVTSIKGIVGVLDKGGLKDMVRTKAMKRRMGPLPKSLLTLPLARDPEGLVLKWLLDERLSGSRALYSTGVIRGSNNKR